MHPPFLSSSQGHSRGPTPCSWGFRDWKPAHRGPNRSPHPTNICTLSACLPCVVYFATVRIRLTMQVHLMFICSPSGSSVIVFNPTRLLLSRHQPPGERRNSSLPLPSLSLSLSVSLSPLYLRDISLGSSCFYHHHHRLLLLITTPLTRLDHCFIIKTPFLLPTQNCRSVGSRLPKFPRRREIYRHSGPRNGDYHATHKS